MEQGPSRRYWCFVCEKEFSLQGQAEACVYCSNTAFEAIEPSQQNNEPASFQVYQIPSQSPQPQPPSVPPAHPFNNNFVQALHFAPGLTIQTMSMALPPQMNAALVNTFNQIQQSLFMPGGGIANLMNSLFGQNNLTPASPQQVSRLQRIEEVPECSICQQENDKIEHREQRKGVKLPCGHMFHHHCIGPWFERTNTCPSCRVRI